ncbi:hypothetical protein Tco_0024039 [Tanacetum coccineum]
MGIHDFLCLPEWTGAEVQEEPYLDVRPTLQRHPFYCTPSTMADVVIPNPTPEDLAVGTPSYKIVAKAEASQNTTRPNLFVGDSDDESDGDDDACVEILLVTPLRSAVVISPSGNQGRSSPAPTTEGSNTRDSRGKGIMVDDAAAPSGGVSRKRPSSGPTPSFRDVSGDAIHTDFFPFSAGPYYATYRVAGNCEFTQEEWDAPYRPTFRVLTKEVVKDPAVYKTIVDQFPTPGEMVRVEDYRLKGYEEKVAGLTRLELQVSTLKKQVSGFNDKLATSDASFAKSNAKGKERKKKIKSLSKSLDNLHSEVARLFAALNQATILEAERDEEILRLKFSRVQGELLSLAVSAGLECGLSMHRTKDEFADVLKKMVNFMPGAQERLAEASLLVAQTDYAFLNKISEHAVEPLSVILQLELEKLVRPANVPIPRDTRVSPPITKESTVTPVPKSLELSANVTHVSSVVASEQNEEQVNVVVDRSDLEMADGAAPCKSGGIFVQRVSHVLDDVVEVTAVESECISSVPTDVVVALSVGGKGDGSIPSFTVEEVVVPPSGV